MIVKIIAVFIAIYAIASPLHAQIVTSISADSDSRSRGRSESRGQAVINGSISYDNPSGIYTGATISFTIGNEVNGPLSYTALLGYATKLNRKLSIDSGFVVAAYTDRYSGLENDTFIEFYSGLSYKTISGRIRYSPDYQEQGLSTLYLELDTVKRITDDLSFTAHVGLLSQLGGDGSLGGRRSRYDFQAGLVKDFNSWSASGTLHLGGPSGGTYFSGPWDGRAAIVVGLSKSF